MSESLQDPTVGKTKEAEYRILQHELFERSDKWNPILCKNAAPIGIRPENQGNNRILYDNAGIQHYSSDDLPVVGIHRILSDSVGSYQFRHILPLSKDRKNENVPKMHIVRVSLGISFYSEVKLCRSSLEISNSDKSSQNCTFKTEACTQ